MKVYISRRDSCQISCQCGLYVWHLCSLFFGKLPYKNLLRKNKPYNGWIHCFNGTSFWWVNKIKKWHQQLSISLYIGSMVLIYGYWAQAIVVTEQCFNFFSSISTIKRTTAKIYFFYIVMTTPSLITINQHELRKCQKND